MKKLLLWVLVLALLVSSVFLLLGFGQPSLLDHMEPTASGSSLYYVGRGDLQTGDFSILYDLEGNLLMQTRTLAEDGVRETIRLELISLKTGKQLARQVFTQDDYAMVTVVGSHVVCHRPTTGDVWLYDASLREEAHYTLPPVDGGYVFTPDLQTVYLWGWEQPFSVIDLATMEETVLLPAEAEPRLSDSSETGLIVSYLNGDSQQREEYFLDLTTGEGRSAYFPMPFTITDSCGELWLGSIHHRSSSYLLGSGEEIHRGIDAQEQFLRFTDDGHLLAEEYDRGTVSLYDVEGRLLNSMQLPNGADPQTRGYMGSELIWSEENGGYFFMLYSGGTEFSCAEPPALMFWDTSIPTEGPNLPLRNYEQLLQTPQGNAVSPELYRRAEEISKTYGVTVRIADQCETDYSDFTTCIITDPVVLSLALDELETCLAAYPAGFFPQLLYNEMKTVEIQLTGPLVGKEHFGMAAATAFAQSLYDKHLIVADCYMCVEQVFHHEVSHLIDDRLLYDSWYREEALFSEDTWAGFNPPDFSYGRDYGSYEELYADPSYFIDSYAASYPTEDRARIWEYAMTGSAYMFQTEPLRGKLDYYNRCIRDCFNTDGWPEVLPSEQVLLEVY